MERIAQLLDDLDDLVYAIGLLRERFRKLILALFATCFGSTLVGGGVILALFHPPMAMATALILFVYRAVTSPRLEMI